MRFFIPAAEDKEQETNVYSAIKMYLSKELGASFSCRRVYKLKYVHEGQAYHAEVGQIHGLNGEHVVAILHEPNRELFHVCTANRGVIRGMPILVGKNNVRASQDFEKAIR